MVLVVLSLNIIKKTFGFIKNPNVVYIASKELN